MSDTTTDSTVTADQTDGQTGPFDGDLAYLQAELEWVETRCKRIIAARELDRISGDVETVDSLLDRGHWHDEDRPAILQRKLEALRDRERQRRRQVDRRLEQTRAAYREGELPQLALDRLCEMYGLDDFERTVLLLAGALAFSQRFEEMYTAMSDRYGGLSVETTFNFADLSFSERITRRSTFARTGALLANDLISLDISTRFNAPEDLLTAGIRIANRTFGFLVGEDGLMDDFMEFSSVEEPRAAFDQVVLDAADKQRILSVVERHDDYLAARKEWGFDDVISYGRGALMLFYGKPGTGKTMMAHAVANRMGKRVLNVDIPTFLDQHNAEHFLPGLFREARLQDAVLFFDECEVLFGDRRMGNTLMTMLLTELERFEGVAILATNLPQQLDEALDRRILVKVNFPEPDRVARKSIWEKHLPEDAPLDEDVDLEALADRFEMAGGYIKNAVLTAVADAVHRGGEGENGEDATTIDMDTLERCARRQIVQPADSSDTSIVQPKVHMEDVVLPEDLENSVFELIDAARHRRTVLELWGIGERLTYGKGVSAMFFGDPGTGKTLCAEAVASELNRPLLVASVPGLKSKWVGQTERNLERLFDEAKAHNAVLFLDEADSLLMARGEGRASRHDDSIVNVLLTKIERQNGVVLLATNRRTEMDAALDRRLNYVMEFPMPTAELRAEIWHKLLPDSVPVDGELDFRALGEGYELTGGRIKNAVFKAAFRAARDRKDVTMGLLEQAAADELGEKQGRIGF